MDLNLFIKGDSGALLPISQVKFIGPTYIALKDNVSILEVSPEARKEALEKLQKYEESIIKASKANLSSQIANIAKEDVSPYYEEFKSLTSSLRELNDDYYGKIQRIESDRLHNQINKMQELIELRPELKSVISDLKTLFA